MSRSRLTIAVALTLTAVFQVYAQWAESFTRIETQPQPPLVNDALPLPRTFVSVAERVLPDQEWMRNARYAFQRGDGFYIYSDSIEYADPSDATEETERSRLQLSPFVLVWIDPKRPEAEPYVVHCEAARVQFENPVTLNFLDAQARSPGRVIAATLVGRVQITGPDGLAVQGENFDFSEEALSLYSAYSVRFQFGPTAENQGQVRGAADGITIKFSDTINPDLGDDMPRVGALERIQLQRNVVLDCVYEEKDAGGKTRLASARITCDDSLDYHAAERYATLLKNVTVRRPTGGTKRPQESDTLHCHLLRLQFVERKPSNAHATNGDGQSAAGKGAAEQGDRVPNPFAGLVFSELKAQGNRAVLQSDEHRLVANMHQLHYSAETGVAELTDAESVRVQREETVLNAPRIRIASVPADGRALECIGPGRLLQLEKPNGDPLLEATWSDRLRAAPDPSTGLMLVRIDGEVRLIQPQKAGIRADRLSLWIAQEAAEQLAAVEPGGRAPESAPIKVRDLPLKYALAEGDVVMASPEIRLQTEELKATFERGSLPHGRTATRNGRENSGEDRPPEHAWHLESRRVTIRLLTDGQTDDVQVAEAIAEGEVLISQVPSRPSPSETAPSEPALTISGSRLHLVNQGHTHQVLNMLGSPALMRRGRMLLEGSDLRLDRSANLATIVGEGLLQVPVERDLNGTPLDEPKLLDVKWQEEMTFDGQRARFLKGVLLRLNDSLLQCEEMIVRVDRPLKFTDERPDTRDLQIRDVHCRELVKVEIYEWDENRLIGLRKGELTEFALDYQSGDFQGLGPGVVNHWARSEGRRVAIAERTTAQANQPVQSDPLDWEHINLRFDDLVNGNFKQRVAELHGRVRMMYAPVKRVSETFTRDDLSGDGPSVEHAVWLGCDTLSISLQTVTEPENESGEEPRESDYLMIGAVGRCELDGKLFHAKAHSLSYDEYKMQFTLRGQGHQEASIYYQEHPGVDVRRVGGQTIWFIPSRRYVHIENSSGIQGVQ